MPVPRRSAPVRVGARAGARVVAAVLRRPGVWPTAVRLWLDASPVGWWRRPPFVPRPDRDYVAWRLHTAYGDGGLPQGSDIVDYLEWCRVARHGAR